MTHSPNTPEPPGVYASNFAVVPRWVYRRLRGQYEALDFYIWLNIHVVGEGGQGYKRNAEIAELMGISLAAVKRRIKALRDAGVMEVRRFATASGRLGQNTYVMLQFDPEVIAPTEGSHVSPPEGSPGEPTPSPAETPEGSDVSPQDQSAEGSPDEPTPPPGETVLRAHGMSPPEGSPHEPSINPPTTTTHKSEPHEDSLRSSSATATLAASQQPLIPDEVLDGVVVDDRPLPAVRGTGEVTAQTLLGTMIDGLTGRGIKMPGNIKARWGKEFKQALDDGFPEEVILEALRVMFRERTINNPSWLPRVLLRVQTGEMLPEPRLTRVDAAAERRAAEVGKTGSQVMQELMSEFDMETGRFRR